MRVQRLELTGIGPFRHQQVIDFAQLSESGLFLIDGPTGAGKTTIIDAIVFALFSTLSGESSSKERIRSDHSLGREKSEVVLDFSVQGRQHRITRSPAYFAAKAHGEGFTNKPAKQTLIEYNADGSVKTTLTSAADIGAHISRLLNMQAQQFRQLVVLAQGEFAALLRMKPKERLEALRGLLGTKFFQDLQIVIAEEGARSRELLAKARADLQTIAIKAEAYIEDCNRSDLAPHFAILGDSDSTADQRREAFESISATFTGYFNDVQMKLEQARQALDPVEKEYLAISAVIGLITEIEQARSMVDRAESALDPLDAGIDPHQAGERAQQLTLDAGALQPLVEWEKNESQRTELRAKHEQQVIDTGTRVGNFEKELAELPATLAAMRELLAARPALIQSLETKGTRLEAVNHLLTLIDQLKQAQQQDAELAEQEKVADSELAALNLSLQQGRNHVTTLLNQQLEQRVAVLAQALVDGEPCKVCGATNHPDPAHPDALDQVVTESEVMNAEESVKKIASKLQVAVGVAEKARLARQESSLLVAQIQGKVGDNTAEFLAEEKLILTQAISDGENELSRLAEAEIKIEAIEIELVQGNDILANLIKENADAVKALEFLDREESAKRNEIIAAVGELLTANAQQANLVARSEKLSAYFAAHTTLLERERSLNEKVQSHEKLTERFNEIEAIRNSLVTHVSELSDTAAIAESTAKSIGQLHKEYERQMLQNEKLEAEHGPSIRLAGIVTAQSPQNVKKLPLESYALQLRFHHVLEAASHHLDKMSSGRLSFVLDQESQSNAQSGLGIDIFDSWTGETRPPTSLSGGETFYASLSLALGLADVVHAETGGVSLETLFVDEGFGSLDQETLQVVLDQLEDLKSGGRVIGVISHVSEMKDRFPERIVVQPQSDGTSIVLQEATS